MSSNSDSGCIGVIFYLLTPLWIALVAPLAILFAPAIIIAMIYNWLNGD